MAIVRSEIAAAAAFALALVSARTFAAQLTTTEAFNRQASDAIVGAVVRHDCLHALPALHRVFLSPRLTELTGEGAGLVLSVAFQCAMIEDEKAPEGGGGVLSPLELADWVNASETLARAHPAAFDQTPLGAIVHFNDQLRKAKAAEPRRRFLAALARSPYRPLDPLDRADELWLDEAAALADDGDLSRAAGAIALLSDPMLVQKARLDKRFAPLVRTSPNLFDVRATAERALASDTAAMRAHPDRVRAVMMVAEDLCLLGRPREGLDLLEGAAARAAAARSPTRVFSDWGKPGTSLDEAKSLAFRDLGRVDEAVASMARAPRGVRTGNVAQILIEAGRPDEALAAIAEYDREGGSRIPAGRMWVLAERACAVAQLGRTAELATSLARLKAGQADNPEAFIVALYCAGDLDSVASVYVRRLADPDQRADALLGLSDYRRPEDWASGRPWAKVMSERKKQVLARDDVKAAVASAGGVEQIPLWAAVF